MNERERVPTGGERIGIFRRVAVERYSQPAEPDLPEMLTPLNRVGVVAGVGLLAVAVALLCFG